MMRSFGLHAVVAVLTAVSVFGVMSPPEVFAQQPQTSQYVSETSATMEPSFRSDGATLFAGIDECDTLVETNRTLSASFTTTVQINDQELYGGVYHYRYARGEESAIACRDPDGQLHEQCGGQLDEEEDIDRTTNEVDAQIDFETLAGLTNPDVCDEGEYDASHYVQLRVRSYRSTGVDTTEWQYAETRYVLDLVRPDPPELTDVLVTEDSVQVEFNRSQTDDVRNHAVVYSTESFQQGDLVEEVTDTAPRGIDGEDAESGSVNADLSGGETVYVAAVSRDDAGNYSVVSSPMEATVLETRGFWDYYADAGGSETGGYGCSNTGAAGAPAGAIVVFVGLLLVGAVRRRKNCGGRAVADTALVAGCLSMLVVGFSAEAAAYDEEDETSAMFEFKLGPYAPMVDSEFDDGPYEQFFGNRSMLFGELEYDYHVWREIGTLSVAGHAGYGRVSAPAVDQQGEVVDSEEESTLRIIPLKASLVYRYDYSAHEHGVPLVPVAKLGLNYNFWRATDPGGDTMEADGNRAVGGRAGWHATLGLNLHLNFFDPPTAASLEMSWGIENSFLFVDYSWTRANGFGSPGIDLSANHWSAGLAFEF